MLQLPLTEGDFYYALAHARDQHIQDNRSTDPSAIRACVQHGIESLYELRQVRRLPRGARELRKRIANALVLAAQRVQDRRVPASLDGVTGDLSNKYDNQARWETRIETIANDLVDGLHTRGTITVESNYSQTYGELVTDNTPSYIIIGNRWYRDVHKRGLAAIGGRFTIEAKRSPAINGCETWHCCQLAYRSYAGTAPSVLNVLASRIPGGNWVAVPIGYTDEVWKKLPVGPDDIERMRNAIRESLQYQRSTNQGEACDSATHPM